LAQRFDPDGGGQNMSEHVPQAANGVEAALPGAKIFGAHGPQCGLPGPVAAHGGTWLQQCEILQARSPGNTRCASAVSRSHIQERAASGQDFGYDQFVDCGKICAALFRQARVYGCDPIKQTRLPGALIRHAPDPLHAAVSRRSGATPPRPDVHLPDRRAPRPVRRMVRSHTSQRRGGDVAQHFGLKSPRKTAQF
jgi:hypothetical protein